MFKKDESQSKNYSQDNVKETFLTDEYGSYIQFFSTDLAPGVIITTLERSEKSDEFEMTLHNLSQEDTLALIAALTRHIARDRMKLGR